MSYVGKLDLISVLPTLNHTDIWAGTNITRLEWVYFKMENTKLPIPFFAVY
jgi:hypothetical protein